MAAFKLCRRSELQRGRGFHIRYEKIYPDIHIFVNIYFQSFLTTTKVLWLPFLLRRIVKVQYSFFNFFTL